MPLPASVLAAARHNEKVRQRRLSRGAGSRISRGEVSFSLDQPAPSAIVMQPWAEQKQAESERVTQLVMAQVKERGIELQLGEGANSLKGSYQMLPFSYRAQVRLIPIDEQHSGRTDEEETRFIGLFISDQVAAAHAAMYALENLVGSSRPRWTWDMRTRLIAAYAHQKHLLPSSDVAAADAPWSWPCGFWDAVAASAATGLTGTQCHHVLRRFGSASSWSQDELTRLMLLGACESRRLATASTEQQQLGDDRVSGDDDDDDDDDDDEFPDGGEGLSSVAPPLSRADANSPQDSAMPSFGWSESGSLISCDALGVPLRVPPAASRPAVELVVNLETLGDRELHREGWKWRANYALPKLRAYVSVNGTPVDAVLHGGASPLSVIVSAGTLRDDGRSMADAGLTGDCQRQVVRGEAAFSSLFFKETSKKRGNRPFHIVVTVLAPADHPLAIAALQQQRVATIATADGEGDAAFGAGPLGPMERTHGMVALACVRSSASLWVMPTGWCRPTGAKRLSNAPLPHFIRMLGRRPAGDVIPPQWWSQCVRLFPGRDYKELSGRYRDTLRLVRPPLRCGSTQQLGFDWPDPMLWPRAPERPPGLPQRAVETLAYLFPTHSPVSCLQADMTIRCAQHQARAAADYTTARLDVTENGDNASAATARALTPIDVTDGHKELVNQLHTHIASIGSTQRAVAGRMGVSMSELSNWINSVRMGRVASERMDAKVASFLANSIPSATPSATGDADGTQSAAAPAPPALPTRLSTSDAVIDAMFGVGFAAQGWRVAPSPLSSRVSLPEDASDVYSWTFSSPTGATFSTLQSARIAAGLDSPVPEPRFFCSAPMCSSSYPRLSSLRRHCRIEHGPWYAGTQSGHASSYCYLGTVPEDGLDEDSASGCRLGCGQVFTRGPARASHEKVCQGVPVEGGVSGPRPFEPSRKAVAAAIGPKSVARKPLAPIADNIGLEQRGDPVHARALKRSRLDPPPLSPRPTPKPTLPSRPEQPELPQLPQPSQPTHRATSAPAGKGIGKRPASFATPDPSAAKRQTIPSPPAQQMPLQPMLAAPPAPRCLWQEGDRVIVAPCCLGQIDSVDAERVWVRFDDCTEPKRLQGYWIAPISTETRARQRRGPDLTSLSPVSTGRPSRNGRSSLSARIV